MNCNSVQSRLSSYLDGELNGAEMRGVRAHLDICQECRDEVEAFRSFKVSLSAWPVGDVPEGLEERLMTRVFAHESAPARRKLSLVWAGGMMFVVAFVGATLWLRAGREAQTEIGDQIARSRFELARDQAYTDGSDPFYGHTAVLTSSYGQR